MFRNVKECFVNVQSQKQFANSCTLEKMQQCEISELHYSVYSIFSVTLLSAIFFVTFQCVISLLNYSKSRNIAVSLQCVIN